MRDVGKGKGAENARTLVIVMVAGKSEDEGKKVEDNKSCGKQNAEGRTLRDETILLYATS